ncbi:MAG TPA: ABC transporter substrate-binding protein [Candidatus Dormibacteraeota bacterium]|jgi:NitT/TauT family transport system substrate-binding protein|nr:ABC transporter substrate-binding protein [Candidatus Dormibacteraeota bacterium]
MRLTTKHAALGLATVGLLAACGSSNNTTTPSGGAGAASTPAPVSLKIMVGGLNKQIYLPNMLAQRLGYFKEQNLDVTLIDEASGQSAEQEVLAGNVDLASGSYNHTQEVQPQGKFLEAVAQLQLAPGEAEMVDATQTGIKTVADLKGKTLGVTSLGSGTHTLSMAVLGRAGITPDQVSFIPVGAGQTFIAGMKNHKIDAGMTTEPTIGTLISQGVGKVLVDMRTPEATRAALGGDYPFISVFAKVDWVNSNKDTVQRLVNAYVKALKYIANNSAATITDQMPADYYSTDKQAYITALAGQKSSFTTDGKMPAGGPKLVNDIEVKYVPSMKGTSVDLAKTFTNDFAGKAVTG